MLIILTHIDKVTGLSVGKEPTRNGPVLPKFEGLKVLWAKTSKYPTNVPEFICEIADGQDTHTQGVIAVLTQEKHDAAYAQEMSDRAAKDYEQRATPIRNQRNNLLAASDIYVIIDYPISDAKRQEWRDYRQALRDVTLQSTFPDEVVWPEPPAKE